MKALIGLCCIGFVLLGGLVVVGLVIYWFVLRRPGQGFGDAAHSEEFLEKMRNSNESLPFESPLRRWGEAFGGVGFVTGDPHDKLFDFEFGPATPPDMPGVFWDSNRAEPDVDSLPDVPFPFGLGWYSPDNEPPPARTLRAVAERPNLAALWLGITFMPPGALEIIGGMRDLQILEMRVGNDDGRAMEHLAGLSGLRRLNLTLDDPAGVASLRHLTGLTYLYLFGDITDAGAGAAFGRLKQLEILDISPQSLTPAGAVHLGGLSRLETLDYKQEEMTPGHLAALRPLTALRKMTLTHQGTSTLPLSGFGPMPGVEHLKISAVNGASISGLQHLAGFTGLKRLELEHLDLTDKDIAALPPLPNLEELHLGFNRITGRGLACLAGMPKLRTLELSNNPLEDEAMKHIVRLDRLEFLSLQSTNVTKAIGPDVHRMTGLRHLSLVSTAVSPEEAASISAGWSSEGGVIDCWAYDPARRK